MLTTKLPINLKAYREHGHQQCLHFSPQTELKADVATMTSSTGL